MRKQVRFGRIAMPVDCVLILAISLLAQMTAFSAKQGRAVICGDSVQYYNSAEALIVGDRLAHFDMRKPGYGLFLAGVGLAFGNMGWAAVTCNHVLLALLPLAAYGLGRHLHSRLLGWVAACFVLAQLQTVVWGTRMMSDPLFACLLSFGLLLFVVGLSKIRTLPWMASAGLLFGLACLTRGTGAPLVVAATIFLVATMWQCRRRLVVTLVSFVTPVAVLFLFECSLNLILSGGFRPADGTAGATVALRARHFDGMDIPNTGASRWALALLPERTREAAYLCNHIDVWIARHRAIRDRGMTEWEYDGLMARFGWDMIAAEPFKYASSAAKTTLWHLLRREHGKDLSAVPDARRAATLLHPAARSRHEGERYWYAYWGMPHLSLADSIELVDRMRAEAAQRAPFGESRFFAAMRYYAAKPIVVATLNAARWLGSLWPGLAILACGILGIRRRTCFLLAALYVADAVLIGALTPTTPRLQFVWLVPDTTLAAALVVTVPAVLLSRCRTWLRPQSDIAGQQLGSAPQQSWPA
ncbi:MAG: glycosyltransferase family 39 protein [Phycisphaerales bacterium]|nr:MAG: glycosyltransferase family 39 protein [Phycisphaerales bacterium]